MTSATQPKVFSELYGDLINRVRENSNDSSISNQAKRYVNIALQDMHIGYGDVFRWAHRKGRLTTQAPYSTGTVSISKGSLTLTGSGTLWNTANAFSVHNARTTGKIVIAGDPVVYDVSAVGSDTSITLASPFVGTTVSGGSYIYFEDEYDLDADFLRPIDVQFFDSAASIRIIDATEFRRRHPRSSVTGRPREACIVERAFIGNTTPVRRAQLWRPPDDNYSIPYDFVTNKLATSTTGTAQESLTADTDEPIVPQQYRHVIVLCALYNWYRDKKDDTRAGDANRQYVDTVLRITSDTQVGQRGPKMEAAVTGYRRNARSPYSGRGGNGRWTAGSAFDRLEDN